MATKKVKIRRADEILLQAIDLFNKNGLSHISGNQLASALDMSSGNLHYHFKTINDIYRAALDLFVRDVKQALIGQHLPSTIEEVVFYLIDIAKCLWKYRFMCRDIDFIMIREPSTFVKYIEVRNQCLSRFIEVQDFFCSQFGFRPVEPPFTAEELAENSWLIWMGSTRFAAIVNADKTPDEREQAMIYHRIVRHALSLHTAQMPQGVAFIMADVLEKALLGSGQSKSK